MTTDTTGTGIAIIAGADADSRGAVGVVARDAEADDRCNADCGESGERDLERAWKNSWRSFGRFGMGRKTSVGMRRRGLRRLASLASPFNEGVEDRHEDQRERVAATMPPKTAVPSD